MRCGADEEWQFPTWRTDSDGLGMGMIGIVAASDRDRAR